MINSSDKNMPENRGDNQSCISSNDYLLYQIRNDFKHPIVLVLQR